MKNIRYFLTFTLITAGFGLFILSLSGCGGGSSEAPHAAVSTPTPLPSASPSPSPSPSFLGACLKETVHFQSANGGCQDKTVVISKLNLELKAQSDAVLSCETLDEGGFHDWRLPYENELSILIQDGFPQAGNFFSATPAVLWVWTGNASATSADRVEMDNGSASGVALTVLLPHFCVRDATAL